MKLGAESRNGVKAAMSAPFLTETANVASVLRAFDSLRLLPVASVESGRRMEDGHRYRPGFLVHLGSQRRPKPQLLICRRGLPQGLPSPLSNDCCCID